MRVRRLRGRICPYCGAPLYRPVDDFEFLGHSDWLVCINCQCLLRPHARTVDIRAFPDRGELEPVRVPIAFAFVIMPPEQKKLEEAVPLAVA